MNTPAAPTGQTMNPETYVAGDPFAAEHAEFNQNLQDTTAQIAAEFEAARRAEEMGNVDEETPDGPDASPPDPDAADEPESEEDSTETESDPDAEEDSGLGRGVARLVAREVALAAREKDLAAREARVKDTEAIAAKYKGFKPVEELRAQVAINPTEVITSLGGDPSTVIRLMLAEQLGDKAPPELKEFAKEAAHNRRIAELERRLEQKQHAEDQTAFFRAIDLGAREYAKTVGAKEMPTLAALVKAAPDVAHSEIMEEIAKDARMRATQEPDGEPLTFAEAAKRVEGRLALVRKHLAPDMTATTHKKPEAKAKTTPPLSAPKPGLPWQKKDDLMEAGLREAMREFHVQEAASKKQRRA